MLHGVCVACKLLYLSDGAGVSVEAASHLSLFLTTPGSSVSSNQVLHKIAIVDQVGKPCAVCGVTHSSPVCL